MSSIAAHFSSMSPNNSFPDIYSADGSPMNISHIGNVSTKSLTLPNVVLVPKLSYNLLSVGQFYDLGLEVTFSAHGCRVQDPWTGQLLGTGRKQPTLSFSSSHSHSTALFDLVHSDVWGPSPTPTMGGTSDELYNTSPHAPTSSVEDDLPTGNALDNFEPSSTFSSVSLVDSTNELVVPSSSHPTRVRNPPNYLRDYHCFLAITSLHEPQSYQEASFNPLWQQAMQDELQAHENTHTWALVDLLAEKSLIGCKWVYKIKTRSDSSVERYKARLVAKGFTQEYGIDYEETFALVARLTYVEAIPSSLVCKVSATVNEFGFTSSPHDTVLFIRKTAQVTSSNDGYLFSQVKYTSDLVYKAELTDGKSVSTTLEPNVKLTPMDGSPLSYLTRYRQFKATPRFTHYAAVLRIIHYVNRTLFHGLHFFANYSSVLRAYSDVDWAGDPSDRKSTTSYCLFLGNSLISWRSKKQTIPYRSSTEAEYRALWDTTSELLSLRWLLEDMSIPQPSSTNLYCDNQSVMQIAPNDIFHECTKHIEVDCHFIRHHVAQGTVHLVFIGSTDQPVDLFTKAHFPGHFRTLLSKLKLVSSQPP
ncbi:hypothetical protein SLEP1_g7344 [Rubroshorea leprosula]|uniref:Reverse transcriptase Ty1/copia-type domain-containing protein n=1 Tax=Rubroshorea leprosula TaxID=152421 RepID=A0AAV5I748_9ROSI|nr:hypothetical protein SLEP1_g7344 [Rubroshorea leprosula]